MSESKGQIAMVTDDFMLDDIEDLPAFVVFPSGAYAVHLANGIVEKDINDRKALECAMTLLSVEEMTEKLRDSEAPPKPGDIASTLWFRDNKFAMGNYKEYVKSIAERFGVKTVGEINNASKGIDMLIVVKRTYDEKADRYNMNIKKAVIL